MRWKLTNLEWKITGSIFREQAKLPIILFLSLCFFSTRYVCHRPLVLESYEMHLVLTVNLHTMLLASDSYESYFCHCCSSGQFK